MPPSGGITLATVPAQDGCSLDAHLQNWAFHMRAKELPEGLPESACGGIIGYKTVDWDSDGVYSRLDAELSDHCDAAVQNLEPAQRCAVYHEYGLTAVFQFPRLNRDMLLVRARHEIRATLLRRGVVVT